MLTIELNIYHAVALGAFLFWLGGVITDKVSLLSRYCIPLRWSADCAFPSSTAFSIPWASRPSTSTRRCKPFL